MSARQKMKSVYLLIIAHPDDESMFFLPTLYNLLQIDYCEVHILCLSNGNYAKLGKLREAELLAAARIISEAGRARGKGDTTRSGLQVKIIENDGLLDGPNKWTSESVSCFVQEYISSLSRLCDIKLAKSTKLNDDVVITTTDITIITFDQGGVSGHCNHVDTFKGVMDYFNALKVKGGKVPSCERKVKELWMLKSIYNPVAKYIPVVDILLILWIWIFRHVRLLCYSRRVPFESKDPNRISRMFGTEMIGIATETTHNLSFRIFHPRLIRRAMSAHQSQFVWYRKLFILFSRYSYVNDIIVHRVAEGYTHKSEGKMTSTCADKKFL